MPPFCLRPISARTPTKMLVATTIVLSSSAPAMGSEKEDYFGDSVFPTMLLQTGYRHDSARVSGTVRSPPPEGYLPYTHLWVDSHGETHIKECTFHDLTFEPYAGQDQYQQSLINAAGGLADFIVTQGEIVNPWHHCPCPQFVITTAGSWYVNTTDGNSRVFQPGDILWQDDSALNPGARNGTLKATHFSGTAGGSCNQIILQARWTPVIDQPCPF
mmetsp:Transcript_96123/g.206221  ORF Transcript_96123/g.206221 Transcript_96123/m.206221 type:complete len:216 (-) Transcript_96123:81-728(-)